MKKGFKFNFVDLLVLVAVVGVLAFVGIKFVNVIEEPPIELDKIEYSFLCEEVPDFAIEYIEEGNKVYSNDNNDYFGEIKSFKVSDAISYSSDSQGRFVQSSKPNHNSVEVVVSGEGEQKDAGIKLEKGTYGVGHSITIRAGNAKLFGRISGIKKLD